jgi:hypothetical protein
MAVYCERIRHARAVLYAGSWLCPTKEKLATKRHRKHKKRTEMPEVLTSFVLFVPLCGRFSFSWGKAPGHRPPLQFMLNCLPHAGVKTYPH